MAKLGSCGDNLWAFGEYRTSDADRTVQQTGEVILFCYDMDEYYFIYGIHGRFVSYHGNSSSKCCDVVSFDLIEINYISLVATILLFCLDTFLLDKVNYDNPIREMEFLCSFCDHYSRDHGK